MHNQWRCIHIYAYIHTFTDISIHIHIYICAFSLIDSIDQRRQFIIKKQCCLAKSLCTDSDLELDVSSGPQSTFMYGIIRVTFRNIHPYTISFHWFGSWTRPAFWPIVNLHVRNHSGHWSKIWCWPLASRQVKFKIGIRAEIFGAVRTIFLVMCKSL